MDFCDVKSLLEFLKKNSREDLKILAFQELLGLTGNEDLQFLFEDAELGNFLTESLKDQNEIICKTVCSSLVNMSATDCGRDYLVNDSSINKEELFKQLLGHVLNPDSSVADLACMTLSNLSRVCDIAIFIINYMKKAEIEVETLINTFVKMDYNSKGCHLHYLGALFSNLSQICEFRRQLMSKDKYLIQKLLPFTHYETSLARRIGIVATLKNCCFEASYHQWLLGPDVDILPHLLLPLAGSEEFSEEDNDKLPIELQYLNDDKEREHDTEIRKMLLESLHQLCATKFGREYLRAKNAYVILREYHKWEKERSLLLVCENVVNILIRTEEEIVEDNLKEVEIPEKFIKKFEEMDKHYLDV